MVINFNFNLYTALIKKTLSNFQILFNFVFYFQSEKIVRCRTIGTSEPGDVGILTLSLFSFLERWGMKEYTELTLFNSPSCYQQVMATHPRRLSKGCAEIQEGTSRTDMVIISEYFQKIILKSRIFIIFVENDFWDILYFPWKPVVNHW